MTWQKQLRNVKKQAKSAIPLHPHLRMGPIKGNCTVQVNLTVILKAPRKIFDGSAKAGLQKEETTIQRQEVIEQLLQI